ncbi:transcriptional regulator, MarR family [Xylanimonas cellulosilytica DSM 15894]|uniref:Transcriptional regulator, MarR family n=1 Tax=Xylanimonas cellulosilytica (strain DSM 15894 / JCM 12276 / CECT 5975 / KCTC 9989 / LMG 20990 / NBRC 107835 / XIL07) TaxID=446471 RepID=D1BYJ1_XYLCX|nr:MarR family transcriptional regulator [Xylanimonas cellulosilytica]ACZ31863.1 transcriptional regulator, MarR family [Xylanimonas cellulosilytica DSM 15894]
MPITPEALSSELRVSVGRFVRRLRAEHGEADLTEGQFGVLTTLLRNGEMTPGAIAQRERVKPPSMTRTVNALAELGMVEKVEHPTDRRLVVVRLSEAGRREVAETRRRRDAWLAQKLRELPVEDRAVLARAHEILRDLASCGK